MERDADAEQRDARGRLNEREREDALEREHAGPGAAGDERMREQGREPRGHGVLREAHEERQRGTAAPSDVGELRHAGDEVGEDELHGGVREARELERAVRLRPREGDRDEHDEQHRVAAAVVRAAEAHGDRERTGDGEPRDGRVLEPRQREATRELHAEDEPRAARAEERVEERAHRRGGGGVVAAERGPAKDAAVAERAADGDQLERGHGRRHRGEARHPEDGEARRHAPASPAAPSSGDTRKSSSSTWMRHCHGAPAGACSRAIRVTSS